MKEKIKTTSFWLGVSGAVVVILDTISGILGVKLYSQEIESVLLTLCSVLIILGFVNKKDLNCKAETPKTELLEEVEKYKDEEKK